jgi:hypothetical protein
MTWILPKQLHTSAFVPGTEALISDLNEQSQTCEQSLLARSKPSPARTWSLKWKRDAWTQHLSGRILKPSLGTSFGERWTSCLAATLASRSAQQDCGRDQTTQDTCGQPLQTEFPFSSQPCAFLKTSRDTSALDFRMSSKTWAAEVTRRRGDYSARLKSAHLTSESGCSSWPTSSTRDHKGGYNGGRIRNGKVSMDTLDVAVQAVESGLAAQASPSSDGSRPESWATPKASDPQHSGPNMRDSAGNYALPAQVVQWATPIVGDSHLASTPEVAAKRLAEGKVTLSRQTTGKLNPRWVETLMGLPVG